MQSCLKILEETVQSTWGIISSEEVPAQPSFKQDGWVCELLKNREGFAAEWSVGIVLLPAHHIVL